MFETTEHSVVFMAKLRDLERGGFKLCGVVLQDREQPDQLVVLTEQGKVICLPAAPPQSTDDGGGDA